MFLSEKGVSTAHEVWTITRSDSKGLHGDGTLLVRRGSGNVCTSAVAEYMAQSLIKRESADAYESPIATQYHRSTCTSNLDMRFVVRLLDYRVQ